MVVQELVFELNTITWGKDFTVPLFCFFSVLQLPSSPSAHDVFSSPITPSSGARRNLFSSSPSAQSAPPVTLSATTRQAAARNAPTCKYNNSYKLLDIWRRVLTWGHSQTSLVQTPKGQSVACILCRLLEVKSI